MHRQGEIKRESNHAPRRKSETREPPVLQSFFYFFFLLLSFLSFSKSAVSLCITCQPLSIMKAYSLVRGVYVEFSSCRLSHYLITQVHDLRSITQPPSYYSFIVPRFSTLRSRTEGEPHAFLSGVFRSTLPPFSKKTLFRPFLYVRTRVPRCTLSSRSYTRIRQREGSNERTKNEKK